jgi:hypothetical protein
MAVAQTGTMNRTYGRLPLALLALAGTFTAAACGRDEDATADPPAPAVSAEAAAAELDADTASIFMAPGDTRDDLPPTIYYDLARFEWYARGEPLVHEGRAYTPAGALFSAGASAMEQVGQFGGVDYYRQAGADVGTLYVPVFERYWLGFRPSDRAATR